MRRAFIVAGPLCALAVIASGTAHAQIVMGTGPGSPPVVRVITSSDDFTFEPYGPAFGGGVNVAVGDVNGDGVADIITGAGPGGGPHVFVLSGLDRSVLASFFAYDPAFGGGVNVAAGDVDGDGLADIITGAGAGGGPHVQVFSGRDLSVLASFFAYHPAFGGGVYVAAGDVDGDGLAEVITGAGAGGGPHVQVIKALELSVLESFFAYDPAFEGGVTVAAGDLNGDGRSDLITGAGPGGGPHVIVYSGLDLSYLASFYAYDPAFGGGVYVAAGDIDGDGRTDLITGAGPGGGPHVRVFSGVDLHEIDSFLASHTGNGVSVGSVGDWRSLRFTSPSMTTFTVGSAGTFTVTTAGMPVPAITFSGALPAGVTLTDNHDGTAILAGTPAAGTGGTYGLTFTADNGTASPATQTFTLTVNQAPSITSPAAVTFPVGAPSTFTVTTTGFPVPTIARGGGVLPNGIMWVDNGDGTGTLSGTAAAGTGGTYALTFTADNGTAPAASQSFTLTVSGSPVITSAGSTTFTLGSAGTFTVTAIGSPTPALSATGVLPAGVTFVDNGNGTGTLSGTPAAGTSGTYAITFTAANGIPPNGVQAFTLNVREAPAITSSSSTTFTVGTPGTFTVTTTGFPAPTVTQSGALPTGVTFTSASGVLAGTPTQAGTFPLVFTAANGVPPDAMQNFTLDVVCPAITVTPLVMPDGLYQTAYAGVDFNQTGSAASSFTWAATGLPTGLSIDTNTGVVSGTPTNTILNGAVAVTVTDNFGCVGTLNTTVTVRPATDNESYTGGVGHTQFAVGVTGIVTPHVFVSDNVKTGDNGPGALSVTFPATSTNGAILEGGTDGTFVYTPNLNFGGPSDSFTYTLTDGNGVTNTGTVTIALSNIVWYVNSGVGNGDGRSHNPFNTLASAATASSTGSIIYVHTGGATTPGDLPMDANQALHGQGAPFALNGLSIASGARPTLTGTVTLANTTSVTAVNFAPGGIPAMTASAVTQPIVIDQVNVTGGTNALSLTNVSGAVTVTNANFTNASGAEVLISQGTGTVNIAAVISSNAGRSIDIQNRTGGTVTFTGGITDTGQGIFLSANAGSTINFTGALALTTGANPAFTATGGGTVSNSSSVVNTITTTTGTALNVSNTTIGLSGLTFRSISANGGTNGIVLNTTGAGGFTVTGNSSGLCGGQVTVNPVGTPASVTAPVLGDCTGGTIQATTGAGIILTNTSSVSLTRMRIASAANDGVQGLNVTGFSLISSLVENNGDTFAEANLDFGDSSSITPDGLHGTGAITNSTIRGGSERNVSIRNSGGAALTAFNVTGSQFSNNSAELLSDDGILVEGTGTATMTIDVQNSYFAANRGDHFQAAASNSANLNVRFTNNTLAGGHATALGQGITINAATGVAFGGYTGTVNYDINSNTINSAILSAITVNLGTSGAAALFNGFVRNNVIGTSGVPDSGSAQGFGIAVDAHGNGTHTVSVTGNTIREAFDRAISVLANDGGGVLNLTVQSNNLGVSSNPLGSRESFFLNNASTTTNVFGEVDHHTVRLDFGGAGALANILTHGVGAPDDFRIRQRFDSRIEMPGYAGSAFDSAAVVAYIQGRNTGSAGEPGSATVNDSPTVTTDGFFSGTVPLPVVF